MQTAGVIDVLRQPRLWIPTAKDYPAHNTWLEKVEAQIADGTKRAMVAYCGSRAVGAVVYQRHPTVSNVLEVRNISVLPDFGDRYMGSFMLRNAELEAARHDFPGVDRAMVDTKLSNDGMIKFLKAHDYELIDVADLYDDGSGLDAVFTKSFEK